MEILVTPPRRRWIYALAAVAAILAGLLWRSQLIPLTPFMSKYGGDAIWALMVFIGLGFLFVRLPTVHLGILALAVSWAIEFSQLIHIPWLDAIRATRLGHLILGSTFNPPDLPAYAIGVLLGVMIEFILGHRQGNG